MPATCSSWRAMAIAALLAMVTAVANAQQAGSSESAALDEIVVTARKTSENIQDIPLAISALTAEQLSTRNVRDTADVAVLTPGLNFEQYSGGFGTPVIRGAAQARISDLDQNVASFFDGIYLPRQYLVNVGVVGLERIEVVKGPQSALYGRNAFMGAINYITRKPDEELRGSVEVTLGDDARRDVAGELSGALVEGRLFGRIAAGYSEYDGDIRNSHPSANAISGRATEDNLGGWDNRAYQARLVYRPVESLDIDASWARFESFEEARAVSRLQKVNGAAGLVGTDLNCSPTRLNPMLPVSATNPVVNSLYCGEIPVGFTGLPGGAPDALAVVDPRSFGLDAETDLVRARVDWRASDSATLIYEFGKATSRVDSAGSSTRDPLRGATGFPFCAPPGTFCQRFSASPNGDLTYQSHELRTQLSFSDVIEWQFGAFLSELHDYDVFSADFGLPLLGMTPVDPATFPLTAGRGRTDVDTVAIFSAANWRINERLRVGAEVRYQEEDKTLVSGPTTFVAAQRALNDRWYQTTPRVSIDYTLSSGNLLYLSAAKGEKAGGFNLSATLPSQFTFAPDENWSYELGSKNTFLDGKLRLNAAVFLIDWRNQQISCSALGGSPLLTPPAVICNLGEAEIYGAEIETSYAWTDHLSLNLGVSYNDAHYGDGVVSERIRDFALCDGSVCPSDGDISGNDLARQSKLQAVLGAAYERPISTSVSGFLSGDVSYKSKQYAEELNLAYVPARTLLNLRLGVRTDNWEVAAWSKNLTNEKYVANTFFINQGTAPYTEYVPVLGPLRSFGITARYQF